MAKLAMALPAFAVLAATLAAPAAAGKPLLRPLNQQERAMKPVDATRLEGLKRHRAYAVVTTVAVDLSALEEGGFSADLFGIPAEVTLAPALDSKGEIRKGRVAGGGDFHSVVNEGKLHATLISRGKTFSIFPLKDGVHVLVETNPALHDKKECGVTHD